MSRIAQVMEATGATRADVVRVATHGGTTRADWDIAHAIEAITGRSAYELMRTAGYREAVAEIWSGSRAEAETPAPTNPRAEYDPEVVVYGENTAPDDLNRIAPHHPHDDDQDQEDDLQAAAELAAHVHADLAEVLADPDAAARLTAAWSTPAEGRELLLNVLEITPRTRDQVLAAQVETAVAA
ncbi:hypothetical protein KIK06_29155 [Nocardiopsis sp. EMB25]|uniref:hypothetical protein n=1 Tax=Nocardiopsis sp. EMB25 TaxID=2835867 RepID=UPI002284AB9F|nr:hypothetical protein [Nocardiopsis sp. EMB25]MCY9787953.1 hypothetical protein [Nocardiopsis sp. EMB25]